MVDDDRPRYKWSAPWFSKGLHSFYRIDRQWGQAGDRVRLNFLNGCGSWKGKWMKLRRAWVLRVLKKTIDIEALVPVLWEMGVIVVAAIRSTNALVIGG